MVSDDDGQHHARRHGRQASGRLALDPRVQDAALTLARALSTTPGVTDMSQHVLAIGTVAP